MKAVLEDKASAKVLREMWQAQRAQTEAAAPLEASFQMEESQARRVDRFQRNSCSTGREGGALRTPPRTYMDLSELESTESNSSTNY